MSRLLLEVLEAHFSKTGKVRYALDRRVLRDFKQQERGGAARVCEWTEEKGAGSLSVLWLLPPG